MNLKEYFILYKPKDIVSGDFYWAAESEDGFLIACVDCTGHGVPGAFMSLIGKENLDKAVVKTNSPKQLLQELNKGVKKSLNQNGSNLNRDGMDAAIVRIENEENGISKVFYSGANRPIWIIKKAEGVLEEIKATKQAIGGFTPDDQEFVEHELLLKKGDSIFISTDGFADQFGSDKNKKMTTKRFKDLLHSVNAYNSMQQKQKLEKFFDDWKGAQEQLDDLLVIGIKI
jgi:serine phosphatase RsbU (regulator of sigma subunit)